MNNHETEATVMMVIFAAIALGMFWLFAFTVDDRAERFDRLCTQTSGQVVDSGRICQAADGRILKP